MLQVWPLRFIFRLSHSCHYFLSYLLYQWTSSMWPGSWTQHPLLPYWLKYLWSRRCSSAPSSPEFGSWWMKVRLADLLYYSATSWKQVTQTSEGLATSCSMLGLLQSFTSFIASVFCFVWSKMLLNHGLVGLAAPDWLLSRDSPSSPLTELTKDCFFRHWGCWLARAAKSS